MILPRAGPHPGFNVWKGKIHL